MHLLRIQVPDFRALKDVDITFEKEFTPSIFPLGSQNGGGKSTLLQLIFVLLHCSSGTKRKPFLKNLLSGFSLPEPENPESERILSIIDIADKNKEVRLKFFVRKDTVSQSIRRHIINPEKEILLFSETILLSVPLQIQEITKEIIELKKSLKVQTEYPKNELTLRQKRIFEERTKEIENNLESKQLEKREFSEYLDNILEYLDSRRQIPITTYSPQGDKDEENILLCQFEGLEMSEAKPFLNRISKSVFLTAPSTQVFLFLDRESRRLLFQESDSDSSSYDNYHLRLKEAEAELPGLFTYDFFAVGLIIAAFETAFNLDREEVVKTGEYGRNYHALLNEINSLLAGKQLNPNPDLSGVGFTMNRNGEVIELNPEDLSHGELKRLSIYMWLKSRNIKDSIVLMDEIEIALHPDWQYKIVEDLEEWSPSNQYILATHSYELCQALTPAHVKEIEPKLLKPSQVDQEEES